MHVSVVLHVQLLAADRLLLQECYAFLQRCNISVPREEMEKVDSLRYSFNNIMTQSVSPARHRQWIQPLRVLSHTWAHVHCVELLCSGHFILRDIQYVRT